MNYFGHYDNGLRLSMVWNGGLDNHEGHDSTLFCIKNMGLSGAIFNTLFILYYYFL